MEYFNKLEETLNNVPPSAIINYDETNLSNTLKDAWILQSTSVIMACTTDGNFLLLNIIYEAEHLYTWTEIGLKGARYNRTVSMDGLVLH